jgi:hypothetical protein
MTEELNYMKLEQAIEKVKIFKSEATKRQMYELACKLRDIERDLSFTNIGYYPSDDIGLDDFMILMQKCLIGIPEDQKQLLLPIIREFKLNQLTS